MQGFKQVEGLDFFQDDKYALVVCIIVVRTILSWVATNNYKIHQIDVKSVYLYRELNEDEDIFIQTPPRNLVKDILKEHALKLCKALYGLKQAGRCWYKILADILLDKMKFSWLNYDQAVFYCKRNGKTIIVLFVHIDDIIIAGLDNKIIKGFKQSLAKHISFTDEGVLY